MKFLVFFFIKVKSHLKPSAGFGNVMSGWERGLSVAGG